MSDPRTVPVDDAGLSAALEESRRLGFLGDRPIDEVIDHAMGFVEGLSTVDGEIVDLGSGGGVPGLVIATYRPDLAVMMVDRRSKRTDFLSRIVSRLGLRDRVAVVAADTDEVIAERPGSFAAATARGFGPPTETLTTGLALVEIGGLIVISEPPSGDRWDPVEVTALGAERLAVSASGVVVFRRVR